MAKLDNDKEIGLFVPEKQTLYIIKATKWNVPQLNMDRIRKILMARGILDFGHVAIGGGSVKDISAYYPVRMTVQQAKDKGFAIEELYGSETEKRRVEATDEKPEENKGPGMFKKK